MYFTIVILLATLGQSLGQTLTNQSHLSQPCTPETSFVDIVLVIDSSTSIDRAYYQAIKSFIKLWASDYSIGPNPNQVQFGFVTYALWSSTYGTFSTDSANSGILKSVIADLAYQPFNDRNMFDALTKVSNNLVSTDSNSGWRENAKHLMVVFSGDSFTGPDWRSLASNMRTKFDRVVAVGLTPNAATNQKQDLIELVGGDASNVRLIGDSSGLNNIIPWLESHAC
uniref:VWFA domain-containing protein n=1 Tax=Plectus sambesii TaxID=2011161 RepID=A0A914X3N8_9BILA